MQMETRILTLDVVKVQEAEQKTTFFRREDSIEK